MRDGRTPLLLTVDEASATLGISRSLLYSLIKKTKIKRVKLTSGRSGAVRFRPEDLEAFVTEHVA
jgi:excisionase family DNA binding protein